MQNTFQHNTEDTKKRNFGWGVGGLNMEQYRSILEKYKTLKKNIIYDLTKPNRLKLSFLAFEDEMSAPSTTKP